MNHGQSRPLPSSVGALIDLSAAGYARRAPLYLFLAAAMVALCAIVQFAWPAPPQDVTKAIVVQLLDLFTSAFVVSTVALGVGARVAGEERSMRALLGSAIERWIGVLGAMVIVQFLVQLTLPGGAIGPVDNPVLAIATAPITWLFWGAMSLAGPLAALSPDRPLLAIVTGFGRALLLSLHAANLGRLCLVAFASVVPLLLENVLFDILQHHGVANVDFWAAIPIDALSVGPLAALQSVFALDFARRVTS